MKLLFFYISIAVLFVLPPVVFAYEPVMVGYRSQNEVIQISDVIRERTFYGELKNAPHTFEFRTTDDFTFRAQLMVPDIESSENTISAILIRVPDRRERVTEIARLSAPNALWVSDYRFWEGNTYRIGPHFEQELPAGRYRLEVHTADNLEKYVLTLGTNQDREISYKELLKRSIAVKRFFEKSPVRIIEAGYLWVPILSVVFLCAVYLLRRKLQKVYTTYICQHTLH